METNIYFHEGKMTWSHKHDAVLRDRSRLVIANVNAKAMSITAEFFCTVETTECERIPRVDSLQKGKDESENETIFQWLLPLNVNQSHWVQQF